MSKLYYTTVKLPRVIERLEKAGFNVTESVKQPATENSAVYAIVAPLGGEIGLFWAEGRAPLFMFQRDDDDTETVFQMFNLRRAQRFG